MLRSLHLDTCVLVAASCLPIIGFSARLIETTLIAEIFPTQECYAMCFKKLKICKAHDVLLTVGMHVHE